MTEESEIRFNTHSNTTSQIGIITLNRPNALNALSPGMINSLLSTLQEWEKNPDIHAIFLQATGKAFCAGGDIRQLYQAALTQNQDVFSFFSKEYQLNLYLSQIKKPLISFLNGITMGGGVGITQHGGIRIATENYRFAMPETGIGFFPDVGGSYFLPRLPHHFGFYLALTGSAIQVDTAFEIGLIHFVVNSSDLNALSQRLLEFNWQNPNELSAAIQAFLQKPAASHLAKEFTTIDHCFSHSTVEAIMAALHRSDSAFAKSTLEMLQKPSPTSLKVTLKQCQFGKQLNLAECLQMEYRMVQHFFKNPDFLEGIRAAIIDKDRNPRWQPASLEKIDEALVASYFAPALLELHFP